MQLHKPPILIDEVQYAPELFTYIKIYVDQHHTPGSFWLTSSHIFKSLQGIHVSLAGRVAVLSMTSLTQAESCSESVTPFTVDLESLTERAKHRQAADAHALFERIFKGSMPALLSGPVSNSQIFYSSYISTYI